MCTRLRVDRSQLHASIVSLDVSALGRACRLRPRTSAGEGPPSRRTRRRPLDSAVGGRRGRAGEVSIASGVGRGGLESASASQRRCCLGSCSLGSGPRACIAHEVCEA